MPGALAFGLRLNFGEIDGEEVQGRGAVVEEGEQVGEGFDLGSPHEGVGDLFFGDPAVGGVFVVEGDLGGGG